MLALEATVIMPSPRRLLASVGARQRMAGRRVRVAEYDEDHGVVGGDMVGLGSRVAMKS